MQETEELAQSHPRVTQSPSPEARTTAGALVLARAFLGRVIQGNGKCRRASGREGATPYRFWKEELDPSP